MNETKKPRTYRHITPSVIANFKALKAKEGNGTAAVRKMESSTIGAQDRAFKIAKKGEHVATVDFIDDALQFIGIDAINRLGKLVNSYDERIGLQASQYAIDHLRGQAVRRAESKHLVMSIEAVLGDD